ncbi:unnamed protein product [Acanthoscelides obtectus]|uniref:FLYWCH-type domain-containing protein n=1 Tax=Acanthoscelides obtectus TaxID=200917 RepID=A0A9P0KY92_ACAOB|nr:unnamed protein product [Acanthoscelides obtectus]CAH2014706.1 unnamed protein product [Acanthoscelides obtectus]CAK1676607.1 hypothetical protein AOBTE_LOCUS30849 [Acanthoscelides obtectus]CAK1676620.1 hypothetical protein AOBTE_LOCUS30862 [Acanthoscelides obtectus]
MVYFGRARNHPKVVARGYEYMLHYKDQDKARWRCKNISKTKCKSRLHTIGRHIKVLHMHNHEGPIINYENLVPTMMILLKTDAD